MGAPWATNTYVAAILAHVDGDTSHVETDCGFDVRLRMTVRWHGIDAPEIATDAGRAALAAVAGMLPVGTVVRMRTHKDAKEKYGRYLAEFIDPNGTTFNDRMIREGFAVAYDGGKRGKGETQ